MVRLTAFGQFKLGKLFFACIFISVILSIGTNDSEAQENIGLGVTIEQLALDDKVESNRRTIPIPLVQGDLEYFSLEIPAIGLRNSFRIGFNSTILQYKKQPEESISATGFLRTTYEISTLNFYGAVQKVIQDIWVFKGNVIGGISLFETVLTEAVEQYRIVNKSGGGTEEKWVGDKKDYQIEYNIGLVVGGGLTIPFWQSHEFGFQAMGFLNRTNLKLPDGSAVNPSTLQLQMVYFYSF